MAPARKTSRALVVIAVILLLVFVAGFVPTSGNGDSPPRKISLGSNMRQVMMGLIAYGYDDEMIPLGTFPLDLPSLVAWTDGELVGKIFKDPKHPSIREPFIYVRPVPNAASGMPVLVADPACTDGIGSVVAFADGHIGTVKGEALWLEARRLATLPKARAGGIEAADWTTVPDLQTPPRPAPATAP